MIDINAKISNWFTWKEAIYLPSWNRTAGEADGFSLVIAKNLTETFEKMDIIRNFFNSPVIVHCAYRPVIYNRQVGGVPGSAHVLGKAVDFHIKDIPLHVAWSALAYHCKDWGIRLEHKLGITWLHIDTKGAGVFYA